MKTAVSAPIKRTTPKGIELRRGGLITAGAEVVVQVEHHGPVENGLDQLERIRALGWDYYNFLQNHPDFEPLAATYNVPFHHIPVSPDNKPEAEAALLKLVKQQRELSNAEGTTNGELPGVPQTVDSGS